MFVQRIISLHYDPSDFKWDSDEKLEAFQKALGRMVMFGMANDQARDVELVSIGVDRRLEMTGAYYPTWARGDSYQANTPQYAMDAAIATFTELGRPFVMGGVPREDGTRYSFHS
jgi:hypothetical protein